MATPLGPIINTAVSLVNSVKNPSLSNVAAVSTTAVQITGNPTTTASVVNGSGLALNAITLLNSGTPLAGRNVVNSATRLAQGFLDPNTAGIVGQVSGGINQLFNLFGGPAFGGFAGTKPVALHTDSLTKQNMGAAYSESKDVVFTFVRMDSLTADAEAGGLDFGVSPELSSGFSIDAEGLVNNPIGSVDYTSLPKNSSLLGNVDPSKVQFSPQ